MTSKIIGRAKCPECGFESAHVKESEKCLYRYCPSCGINGPHARTEAQRENMKRGMRPVATPTPTEGAAAPAAAPTPTATPPKAQAAPEPTPTATPPKRRGLFG